MIISKLTLRNFRNYDYAEIEFSPKLNLIVGDNAEGKTNIVEAIYFLSLARSFRSLEITDLIKERRQFATIEARVDENTTHKDIVALMTTSHKKFTCNSKQIRKYSELAQLVNVIVFEPKDTLLFADSPLIRRNFLDINISKKSPVYLENLMVFEKLLKERNAILKNEVVDEVQLDVVTAQLIKVQKEIVRYRSMYITEINQVITKILNSLEGTGKSAEVIYEPFVDFDDNFEKNCARAYERYAESDIKHKMTQLGIHREDFRFLLNGKDIASQGSQGENRIAAIALKISPYFLIEDRDKKPIVILDDVMSELDYPHRQRLLKFLSKMEQVFITATELKLTNASIYEVKKQKITRRNA